MKLERVEIENYRAIEKLDLSLDPALTVFHGDDGHGRASVPGAIAAGLGNLPTLLPEVSGVGFPPGVAGTKGRLRSWEHGRPARMDDPSGLRPVAGGTPAFPGIPARRASTTSAGVAGGTPALPGRANPGNPASGSRKPGGGQLFVVLSKTSRVRD